MRVRTFPDKNYKALFTASGKTLHMKRDGNEPYLELDFPEILDVAINNKCFGSCNDYCYVAAKSTGHNYDDIVGKAEVYWGSMSMNERPFQIAIGGAGEPTLHPDFPEFVKTLKNLGIMPNYTTNAMHLSDSVIEATVTHCGGVAITCHAHLEKHWRRGIDKLVSNGIRTNLHIIPMSTSNIDDFVECFLEYRDKVEYFVILPYQPIGFGKPIDMAPVYEYLFDTVIATMDEDSRKQIAYGAYFYDELASRSWIKADLYEPGVFSKYLDMDGSMTLYRSSFDWQLPPLATNLLEA